MAVEQAKRGSGGRVPPHDLEAEEGVIGAMLLSKEAIAAAAEICVPGDFYKPSHGHAFAAAVEMHTRGDPVDPVLLADELLRHGLLESDGGVQHLVTLQARSPATSNTWKYAQIVADKALLRRLIAAADETAAVAYDDPLDAYVAVDRALDAVNTVAVSRKGDRLRQHSVTGGAFIFDGPSQVEALWGAGDEVLWARGESLMIVGPAGVGKTTIAQQLALARIGLRALVLGQPVAGESERVLYVAADRPAQARRSMRRMVTEHEREWLDERLVFWPGPPPISFDSEPSALLNLAKSHGADTVIVDSLKDVAAGLSDDLIGSKVNIAIQTALAAGIEVIEVHHQRKEQRGTGKPRHLSDVYGSTWLTAGAGSVVLIWGEAGDAVVELSHLKQPAGVVGPLQVVHDHLVGDSTVEEQPSPWSVLVNSRRGVSVAGLAMILWDSTDRSAKERARRALEGFVKQGRAHRRDGERGGEGGGEAALYFALEQRREPGEEPLGPPVEEGF